MSNISTKSQKHYEILSGQRERRLYQADALSAFLFALNELDILNLKWSPTLWHTTVDKVTVNADGSVVFSYKNGSEVELPCGWLSRRFQFVDTKSIF